ncbi:Hypothetical predicted protein, partial [Marmota monax]
MASKASSVEDSPKEVGETKQERGKGKPRHKFTKHDLEILNRSFEQNSYPEFSVRKELAKQMNCQISEVNIWFQNKRFRLQRTKKERMFVTRRHGFPVQDHHLVLGHQDAQMQYDNSTTTQPSFSHQAPPEETGYFPMKTCGLLSEEDGSCISVFPGMRKEPSCTSLGQGARGSEPSPSFAPATYSHPASSLQHFERATFMTEESQQRRPLPLFNVNSVQGKMQQQQDQQLSGLCGGQQQSDWVYYNPQLQQLQDASWQKNGEDSSSQIQCTSTPQMELSFPPEPFGLDGHQLAREQPRSPKQQVWGEGYELFDDLPLPCVDSAQGKMQQQQDMDLFDLWGGQQESDWVYYNPQL